MGRIQYFEGWLRLKCLMRGLSKARKGWVFLVGYLIKSLMVKKLQL